MPKTSEFPRLRTHVKRGKKGQVWVSYWYDMRGTGQADIALGSDRAAAILRWHDLQGAGGLPTETIGGALHDWSATVLPSYASAVTRRDYERAIRMLSPVFGECTWADVELPDLRGYLAARKGKSRANRELSVLRVVWSWALLEGRTKQPWPAVGLEKSRWKNKEKPRRRKVTLDMLLLLHKHADETLRDALDLISATAMRITDARQLTLGAADEIAFEASKTGKEAAFDLSPILADLLARRRAKRVPHLFVLDANGKPVTERMLTDRFAAARAEAAKEDPACADLILRDMRKLAAQLKAQAGGTQAAVELLQHGSASTTIRHYLAGVRLQPAR